MLITPIPPAEIASFMLVVPWSGKKQNLKGQSTVEAEYIALSFAVRKGLWLRTLRLENNCFPTPIKIWGTIRNLFAWLTVRLKMRESNT